MPRPKTRRAAAFLSWLLFAAGWADAGSQELSDAIRANRPAGGEYLGLYLLDKKVGYLFSNLALVPDHPDEAQAVEEAVFKVTVGGRISERFHRETRRYEAKPNGRLLSFVVEQKGDGGEQTLEGTATASGLVVVRKRPGQPNQVLHLPPCRERVEDADQARVALYRNQRVQGTVLDADDLGQYRISTELGKAVDRVVRGVKVQLREAITISDKEKVPAEAYFSERGALVEVDFGQHMKGRAEPESVAKRLDQVEVFGLTRIVLPKPLPDAAHGVPGSMTLVMSGLPERFWKSTPRQTFTRRGEDKVEVTVQAAAPSPQKRRVLPLLDPAGGANLKSTIVVESDSPEIRAAAQKIVGGERDAYQAAKKIVDWVGRHMVKDYGASADRATDVLRQMRGDCTEHSLLSVALMRAVGIPAKRVDGVVYLRQADGVPAFYWHEWVEAFVGEWTQLDPTFGQEVADATHLAVGEEGNAEIVPLIGQLRVLDDR